MNGNDRENESRLSLYDQALYSLEKLIEWKRGGTNGYMWGRFFSLLAREIN
ncbi:hypothetical protein C789_962 [Microcystis aeruginosa FACHB-905 = DIANCHI905]|uniref:Uncharacterized protein n=1 Tax=Microcystis aeruginosa PCC 7806SL TaxID=1903187 RepID=A0AB33BT81_MICA7|nr:hypothetical protein BH695_3765 [Microcystis aeruginosa PCC 7806SL]ELS49251.1 hypothetical protein C789_962 [Microcystis aeruginosa FACHB-905 = DIANCHI905]